MLDGVRRFVQERLEKLSSAVQEQARRQMERMGVATKEEVSSLRRQIRDLEGKRGAGKARATGTTAKSSRRKTATTSSSRKTTKRPAKTSATGKRASKKTVRKSSRPARRA